MSPQNQIAEEQAALWNGHSGQAWTEAQELMDGMLQPFKDHLLAAISVRLLVMVFPLGFD
jgi:hypothetical protein